MKIEVNLSKKSFLLFASLIFIITAAFVVYAYGTNVPPTFGHSGGEVDVNCPTGTPTTTLLDSCLFKINSRIDDSSSVNPSLNKVVLFNDFIESSEEEGFEGIHSYYGRPGVVMLTSVDVPGNALDRPATAYYYNFHGKDEFSVYAKVSADERSDLKIGIIEAKGKTLTDNKHLNYAFVTTRLKGGIFSTQIFVGGTYVKDVFPGPLPKTWVEYRIQKEDDGMVHFYMDGEEVHVDDYDANWPVKFGISAGDTSIGVDRDIAYVEYVGLTLNNLDRNWQYPGSYWSS